MVRIESSGIGLEPFIFWVTKHVSYIDNSGLPNTWTKGRISVVWISITERMIAAVPQKTELAAYQQDLEALATVPGQSWYFFCLACFKSSFLLDLIFCSDDEDDFDETSKFFPYFTKIKSTFNLSKMTIVWVTRHVVVVQKLQHKCTLRWF